MFTLEEFITQTNKATTSVDVFEVLKKTLASYGYDRVIYTMITDFPQLGLKAGHGIMRNYPEDWMNHYNEKNYYPTDPVPITAVKQRSLFLWKDIMEQAEWCSSAIKMMNESRDAHLFDGFCVPFHGPLGTIAGMGIASSTGHADMSADHKSLLTLYATQFHLAFSEREATKAIKVLPALTAREQEILSWAAEGKSDQDIADIMFISYATVRFHMNNAFRKLDANERTYAVVKAIRHGLIRPAVAVAV
jgi:DNA-binding CsgD family transcriptional regulator